MADLAEIQAKYFPAAAELPARRFVDDHPAGNAPAPFDLVSEYQPAGDQPQAIADLVGGLRRSDHDQVLLAKIARTDDNKTSRVFAVAKLTDQALLAEIAKTDEHPNVRDQAVSGLTDRSVISQIEKTDRDFHVRKRAKYRLAQLLRSGSI